MTLSTDDQVLILCATCDDGFRPGQSCRCSEPETIEAYKLRPGHRVLIYGGPVTILEAICEPAFKPAKTVTIRFRCAFAEGTYLDARIVAAATRTFVVHDDGSPF
jgi:hypothetical protein